MILRSSGVWDSGWIVTQMINESRGVVVEVTKDSLVKVFLNQAVTANQSTTASLVCYKW